MSNAEAIRILECMAIDMTGALMESDKDSPKQAVLMQKINAINLTQKALRDVSMQGWINVNDKLPVPEEYGPIVIVTDGKDVFPLRYKMATARQKIVARWEEIRNRIYHGNAITHWMPFPQLPKEVNHES